MRTLDDLLAEGVSGRRVFLRADLNVPLDKSTGEITDDGRIRASLPTLPALLDGGARVTVAAHLGRPKGAPDPQYSLAPVAARLSRAARRRRCRSPPTSPRRTPPSRTAASPTATCCCSRTCASRPGETSKDDAARGELADRLAALADVYVDDAFGAVHRKHASVFDIAAAAAALRRPAGRPRARGAARLTTEPERPYVVVLGGSKVSDKLAVIEALLPKVDRLLVGGGMCFTFLAAQGHERRQLAAGGRPGRHLPPAARRGRGPDRAARRRGRAPPVQRGRRDQRRPGRRDPGRPDGPGRRPAHRRAFAAELGDARTVFWNGPMGVFELAPFAGAPAAWPRRSPPSTASPWSVAATRRPPSGSSASTRPLRPHQHRRRRVAGVPRGPRAAGPRRARRVSRGRHGSQGPHACAGRRRPLIAGNWKMHLTHLDAIGLVQKLAFSLKEAELEAAEVVVLPPFTALRSVQTLVTATSSRSATARRTSPRRTPAPTPARSAGRCSPRWAASTSSSGTPSGGRSTPRTTPSSRPRRGRAAARPRADRLRRGGAGGPQGGRARRALHHPARRLAGRA